MLVKSFTDDLAWKVQRDLVDSYFRVNEEIIQQTVTINEPIEIQTSEIYLEASKIMSGCLEGNRPYVLNILRHIVPDVDVIEVQQKVTEIQTEVRGSQNKKQRYITEGVPIDINKLILEIGNQKISIETLAKKANVSVTSISNWIAGKHQPVLQNRTNLCIALGKGKDYLTPKRTRNVKVE